jgi:hypothetical protein
MSDPHAASLDVVTPDAKLALSNLVELYEHDMSAIFQLEVGSDGRFGYDKLPLYWSEPNERFAFFIRSGKRLAGFALATRGSPATDDAQDLDVAGVLHSPSLSPLWYWQSGSASSLEPSSRAMGRARSRGQSRGRSLLVQNRAAVHGRRVLRAQAPWRDA